MAYAGRTNWQEKLALASNKLLQRLFPTYRFQEELSLQWRRSVRSIVEECLAEPSAEIFNAAEKMKLGFKLGGDDCMVPRYSYPAAVHEETSDISQCYRCVYNPFNESSYKLQLNYLRDFLNTCKARNIHVLLVNMPLRQDSFALMPPGLYERYMSDVTLLSRQCGASTADLNREQAFKHSDFIDQVHLSGRAVPKFLSALSSYLPGCLDGCNQQELGMKTNHGESL